MRKESSEISGLIAISSSQSVAVSGEKIECILDRSAAGLEMILQKAKQQHRYQNHIVQSDKIRSYLLMRSGKIYASAFSAATLVQRLQKQGIPMLSILSKEAFISVSYIESIYDAACVNQEGHKYEKLRPLMDKEGAVRSVVRLENGFEYPSSFSAKTLYARIQQSIT